MIHIFIVNPYAGGGEFAVKLREQIPQDIEYYIFTVTNRGGEAGLVRQIRRIYEGEELRIYCCGGSGTFRNAMQGIDDFSKIEMAFIPTGMTNDFLKVFGKDAEQFKDVKALVEGRIVKLDYIKTNHGSALNSLSCGLDTNLMNAVDKNRLASTFGKQLPYILGLFSAVFFSFPQEYVFTADDTEYRGKFSEVYVGNGGTIGGFIHFTANPNVTDGKAHFFLVPNRWGFSIVNIARLFNTGKMDCEKQKITHDFAEKFTVRRADGKPFEMNFDGEIEGAFEEWNVEMVNKGLKFVVPKGVSTDGI